MRIYWIERVDFWAMLALLGRQLCHRRFARLICYETPAGNTLLHRVLRAAGIVQMEAMARALGDMVNDRGINLYWHNDELMLAATERTLADLDIKALAPLMGVSTDMFRIFLTRAALADLHQQTLRATALWGNSISVESGDQHLLLADSAFFNELAISYRRPGLSVTRYWRPFRWLRLIREQLATAKQILRACLSVRPATTPPEPVIAVQYVAGLDRNRINDIPWFEASGLRPDQILIYKGGKWITDAAAGARAFGFHFVDLPRWLPTRQRRRFISDMCLAVATSLRLVFKTSDRPSRRIWLSFWIAHFLRSEARWRAFFAEQNVKIHLHVGDADALALAATTALGKLGGLDFAFQLGGSSIELAFEYRALTDRVLFAWGNFHRHMNMVADRRVPGKLAKAILVIGHPHDYLAALHSPHAQSFRTQMHARNIQYLIVGFDNVARQDFLISPNHVVQFYQNLVEIALSDRTVAVMVKPKVGSDIRLASKDAERLADLKAEGRWIELPKTMSVFEAAARADLVIALHMNTTAMEAAIVGIPHIYYVPTGWDNHPFYRLRNKLIAANQEELRELVAQHRAGEGFDRRSPEFERYRRELSPFDDKSSASRMAVALKFAFDGLVAGESSSNVCKQLAGDFASRFPPPPTVAIGHETK